MDSIRIARAYADGVRDTILNIRQMRGLQYKERLKIVEKSLIESEEKYLKNI